VTDQLRHDWISLYGEEQAHHIERLIARAEAMGGPALPPAWWQHAVVYSLYVEGFADDGTFDGLRGRLDHLVDLGVDTLWLLPILESPMRDDGFDVSDHTLVRADLGGGEAFQRFLLDAHDRGMRVVFDFALNHVSDEHPWFREALRGGESARWFHWSDDGELYSDARLLFKGMVPSNWEPVPEGADGARGKYYFHRFYPFQPDLDYNEPDLFAAILRAILGWVERGVDGLRLDAIPFLWKEDGTDCENLPQVHVLLRIIRGLVELARPNTLLLAEACQPPEQVRDFLGSGDECQGVYHFPLMPRMWLAAGEADAAPLRWVLDPTRLPPIPDESAWFVFLRVHDELTLEFLDEDEMDRMRRLWLRDPSWSFRDGEGISARMATLLDTDPRRILGLFSVMLTIGGTPVIYHGDEFALGNDEDHRAASAARTGWDDSRFLLRAPIPWEQVEADLLDPRSATFKVYEGLRAMLLLRRQLPGLLGGERRFLDVDPRVAAYSRGSGHEEVTVLVNLSGDDVDVDVDGVDLLTGRSGPLAPYEYRWLATPNL
jgi:maltose alpha-D-glucosyltransferase/alpha-amylase